MRLELTRFTVSLAVFLAWTAGTMLIRFRRPIEDNWPVVYWAAILGVSIYWDRDTWDARYVIAGLAAGLFLRFEFINRSFEVIFRTAEFIVFGYILWKGVQLLTA